MRGVSVLKLNRNLIISDFIHADIVATGQGLGSHAVANLRQQLDSSDGYLDSLLCNTRAPVYLEQGKLNRQFNC